MKVKTLKSNLIKMGSTLENPSLESRVILSYLGLNEEDQIVKYDDEVDDSFVNKAILLMEKRVSGYPSSYITGKKDFYLDTFKVKEGVLIPRPESESLVECGVKIYKENKMEGNILDLCTGTGCVGISIGKVMEKDVFLSDISPLSIEVAKDNYLSILNKHGDIRQGDLFLPWKGMKFSLIVSNPPYLTESWYESVSEDVKKEPPLALLGGGECGLDIISRIIKESDDYLEEDGFMLLECDPRQIKEISVLLKENSFINIKTEKDLSKKERVIYGRKK